MKDLLKMTNVTGDEFNMFTKGSERLIIRGEGNIINVPNQQFLDELTQGKYGKFSGHTHPPGSSITPGPKDRPFLDMMKQKRSAIWGNIVDEPYIFGSLPIQDEIFRQEIAKEKWLKYYENN